MKQYLIGLGIVVCSLLMQASLPVISAQVKNTVQVTSVIDVVDEGKIDWTKGEIRSLGVGLPQEGTTGAQARLSARQAAIADAERNLAKIINGIHVSSETTVEDMMLKSDVIKTRVSAFLQGAVIISEKNLRDGSYEVVMGLLMYGSKQSLAQSINYDDQVESITGITAVPQVKPAQAPEVVPEEIESLPVDDPGVVDEYTGVLIDCRGLPLTRSMCPRILDQTGKDLWEKVEVSAELMNEKGLAAYYHTADEARQDGRVGKHPLIITALRLGGSKLFKTDAILNQTDTRRLLAANQKTHFLGSLAVGFLVD